MIRFKSLVWSINYGPNEYHRYDHCIAKTSIGDYIIEWKGWKEHPSYSIEGPNNCFYTSDSLDDAKKLAHSDYIQRIVDCIYE